jgi:hypothetical protein
VEDLVCDDVILETCVGVEVDVAHSSTDRLDECIPAAERTGYSPGNEAVGGATTATGEVVDRDVNVPLCVRGRGGEPQVHSVVGHACIEGARAVEHPEDLAGPLLSEERRANSAHVVSVEVDREVGV